MPSTIIKKGAHISKAIVGTSLIIEGNHAPGSDDEGVVLVN
jgi:ADP-glucose pyrophosphorylase